MDRYYAYQLASTPWTVRVPAPAQPFLYHFFVSYTTREPEIRESLPFIDDFVARLVEAGFRQCPIFFDRAVIGTSPRPDYELEALLRSAIESSVCMLAFVSPGYVESRWCHFGWRNMHLAAEHCPPMILPIVWKDLGYEGWQAASHLPLSRLPLDVSRRSKLQSASWPGYFPMEIGRGGWGVDDVLRETADFLLDRSVYPGNRRRDFDVYPFRYQRYPLPRKTPPPPLPRVTGPAEPPS